MVHIIILVLRAILPFARFSRRAPLVLFYCCFTNDFKKKIVVQTSFSKSSGVYMHNIESLVSGLGVYWRWRWLLEYDE